MLGTLLSVTLFQDAGLKTIPAFNAELPTLQMPNFSGGQMRLMFVDAAVLGMLGCIDALLTSAVADSLTRTEHDSTRAVGQGLANTASGLFGGLPGAGQRWEPWSIFGEAVRPSPDWSVLSSRWWWCWPLHHWPR